MSKTCSIGFRTIPIVFFVLVITLGTQGFSQSVNTMRIDSVSVLGATGHVIIGWTLQTAVTQGSIEVHRQLPDLTYGLLNTLNNLNIGSYTDNSVNAGNQAFSYYVASFDQFGGTLAPSLAHQTIFLRQPEADFCAGQVILKWTNYQVTTSTGQMQQRPVPFDGIRIQISADGINYQTLATLSLPQISTELQEYRVSGLNPGQYFFRILAFGSASGHTSTSNIRSFGYNPPQLNNLTIDYIDIFENTEARIAFSASGHTDQFYYELYRAQNDGLNYELAGVLPVISVLSDNPEIDRGPWFYKIKAWLKDWKCELPGFESPEPFSSIFLTARNSNNPLNIELNWEHHLPQGRNFSYQLKVLPLNGQWQNVSSFVASQPGSSIHNIAPGELVGNAIYKLEASDLSNPAIVISSNYATVYIEPLVNIPNAFRPDSQNPLNTVFKPEFPGFTPENYQLRIFNRWGQPIFQSADPRHGWDGKLDTQPAEPGVYSFLLNYTAPGGRKFERRGVVTLVR